MPFITIRVTGDEEAPTKEQKAELIAVVTADVCRILNKNPETTNVIIEEVPMDNYGIGGKTTRVRREEAKKTVSC